MTLFSSTVRRLLSAASSATDNTNLNVRIFDRGELATRSLLDGLMNSADEGSHFVAANSTTPGTGIPQGIQTAFSATANVLCAIANTDTTLCLHVDTIRLINTAAGLLTTSAQIALQLDPTVRNITGGSALTVRGSRANVGAPTNVAVTFGALTLGTAGPNVRTVARMALKAQAAPCWTVGDVVDLACGESPRGSGGQELNGTIARHIVVPCGPIVIPPNSTLSVHLWNIANATTAPSWEPEIRFIQR
jgi:hypothetical protein